MQAVVASPDGKSVIRLSGSDADPIALANRLADEAHRRGADRILGGKQRPLAGKRIVVTRPVDQAEGVIAALAQAGAVPIHIPAIRFEAVGDSPQIARAIAEIDSFDWIVFTSANGVRFFRELCKHLARARIAAVGPATAAALREAGVDVDFVPDEFVGEALARTLGDVAGRRILLPRAEAANADIVDLLRARGAHVDDVPIYRTLSGRSQRIAHLLSSLTASIAFCSLAVPLCAASPMLPTNVRLPELKTVPIVCIGPVTADTARSLGLKVVAVAESHTTAGLIDCIDRLFSSQGVPFVTQQRAGGFPSVRPRRLRTTPGLRALVRETELNAADFIYPLFITHGRDIRKPIRSMPGIHQLSVDQVGAKSEQPRRPASKR